MVIKKKLDFFDKNYYIKVGLSNRLKRLEGITVLTIYKFIHCMDLLNFISMLPFHPNFSIINFQFIVNKMQQRLFLHGAISYRYID